MTTFKIENSVFTNALITVLDAVERKGTMPILSNILIDSTNGVMIFTATDLEREIVTKIYTPEIEDFKITVPARKTVDICKALPSDQILKVKIEGDDNVTLSSGRGRYKIATLPAQDYPNIEEWNCLTQFTCTQEELRGVLTDVHYSMANQDVRYYLNGAMIELRENTLITAATDGHRLALSKRQIDIPNADNVKNILPRQAVLDFIKRLSPIDSEVTVMLNNNHFRIVIDDTTITTKLIDGKFPDYQRVIPRNNEKKLLVNRVLLKDTLNRAKILSNEKFKGVRFVFESGQISITANNPEQEEAKEVIDCEYSGDKIEIGFNAEYILDILSNFTTDNIIIYINDGTTSIIIEPEGNDNVKAIAMPMRL